MNKLYHAAAAAQTSGLYPRPLRAAGGRAAAFRGGCGGCARPFVPPHSRSHRRGGYQPPALLRRWNTCGKRTRAYLYRRGAHCASAPRSGLSWRVRWLRKAICTAALKAPLCKGWLAKRDWGIVTPYGDLVPPIPYSLFSTPPALRATSPYTGKALGGAFGGALRQHQSVGITPQSH